MYHTRSFKGTHFMRGLESILSDILQRSISRGDRFATFEGTRRECLAWLSDSNKLQHLRESGEMEEGSRHFPQPEPRSMMASAYGWTCI